MGPVALATGACPGHTGTATAVPRPQNRGLRPTTAASRNALAGFAVKGEESRREDAWGSMRDDLT